MNDTTRVVDAIANVTVGDVIYIVLVAITSYAVVVGAAIIVFFLLWWFLNKKRGKSMKRYLILALLLTGCAEVGDGHLGYEKPWGKPIQTHKIYGPGIHNGFWFDDLIVVDHREKVTKYDIDIRLASQRINLKTSMAVTWKYKHNMGGRLMQDYGIETLDMKRHAASAAVVKEVVGGNEDYTYDIIFNNRELIADEVLTQMKSAYDLFLVDCVKVEFTDFDLPPEIDAANARAQALVIEKGAEKTQLAIAEMKVERRKKEAEAAAAFQQQVGQITSETLDLMKFENQKLWIEALREGIEKGKIQLVVTDQPVMLSGRP